MKTFLFLLVAAAAKHASGEQYDQYIGLNGNEEEDALQPPARQLRAQRDLDGHTMSMHDGYDADDSAGSAKAMKSGKSAKSAKSESAKAAKAET